MGVGKAGPDGINGRKKNGGYIRLGSTDLTYYGKEISDTNFVHERWKHWKLSEKWREGSGSISHLRGRARTLSPWTNWIEEVNWGSWRRIGMPTRDSPTWTGFDLSPSGSFLSVYATPKETSQKMAWREEHTLFLEEENKRRKSFPSPANRGSHEASERTQRQREQSASYASQKLPTRLIDLETEGGSLEWLKLKDTRTTNLESCGYCALSYCWGKHMNPPWITTKANLQDRLVGFDPSELPATLYDAAFIAQQLQIRYIWIDAICIVQDDHNDWTHEGSKMADIYKGSKLTIAIALGDSSTSGAFNQKSTSYLEDYTDLIRIDSRLGDGRPSSLYFYPSMTTNYGPRQRHVEYGPLSSRAWCLQESLLSSRILYYTQAQLLWQCDHLTESEDRLTRPFVRDRRDADLELDTSLRMKIPQDGEPPLSIYRIIDLWYKALVPQYTTRKLTHSSDKLVAISALAQALSVNFGGEYVAGLWRDTLVVGLLWTREGPGKKTRSYRCPSWSWASQDSAIAYDIPLNADVTIPIAWSRRDYEDEIHFDAAAITAEVQVDQRNPFGAVTGGFLNFSGPLLSGGMIMRPQGQRDRGDEHTVTFWDHLKPLVCNIYCDDDDLLMREVTCAYLGHGRALVLERSTEGEDIYRRIGLVALKLHRLCTAATSQKPFVLAELCITKVKAHNIESRILPRWFGELGILRGPRILPGHRTFSPTCTPSAIGNSSGVREKQGWAARQGSDMMMP
ncbi:hypothetical protein O1611_g6303 [Lasiodiplodia mahajangana]|uniref:Uncharacterized protein n=1 Tax=Lasiodiplodia mahajangana TaxID=1108764 RepID=A0ACC2JIX8_9PEZI|nr:hypothetical protein O1611_g6303 [Lasiodiplodia mahajangana]